MPNLDEQVRNIEWRSEAIDHIQSFIDKEMPKFTLSIERVRSPGGQQYSYPIEHSEVREIVENHLMLAIKKLWKEVLNTAKDSLEENLDLHKKGAREDMLKALKATGMGTMEIIEDIKKNGFKKGD